MGKPRDVELLRLAARAAGAPIAIYPGDDAAKWVIKHSDGIWRDWLPLERDEDADRLAVAIGAVVVEAMGYFAASVDDMLCVETFQQDEDAARRRAIVGIAAMHTIKRDKAAEQSKVVPAPGDLVPCCWEDCGNMTPYTPPYPPAETMCEECRATIAEMKRNGEI